MASSFSDLATDYPDTPAELRKNLKAAGLSPDATSITYVRGEPDPENPDATPAYERRVIVSVKEDVDQATIEAALKTSAPSYSLSLTPSEVFVDPVTSAPISVNGAPGAEVRLFWRGLLPLDVRSLTLDGDGFGVIPVLASPSGLVTGYGGERIEAVMLVNGEVVARSAITLTVG